MSHTVAVLGAGIGAQHIDGYLTLPERFRVTHVCDLDADRAGTEAARAGARATSAIDEVIADPAVSLVDICLPPSLHVPVALKALAAGKSVILEKPIAGSLDDADRMLEAEAASAGTLFPVFQYRFGRAFYALAALNEAGLLGRPHAAALETHWDRGDPYYAIRWRGTWEREMGGAVLSHAIHAHDLLTMAFGPVAAVSAMLDTRINPIETEDCAAIAFRMDNGALATSSITLGAAGNTSRYRFVFEHATIESGTDPYRPGQTAWTFTARDPARQGDIDGVVAALTPKPEGFSGYLAAVADALDGLPNAAPNLAEGVASIALVSAIYHAHRTGARVPLPLDRALPIAAALRP